MAARRRGGEREVRRQALLGLGAALVLLVAIVAVAVFSLHRLYANAENGYFRDALPVRAADRDLLVQLLNEETAVRGYVITGRPHSLQPYRDGVATLRHDLAQLERAATRHPDLAAGLMQARVRIDAIQRFFDDQATLVRKGPGGQRLAAVHTEQGKATFDALRRSLAVLQEDVDAYIARVRTSQRRTYDGTAIFLLAVGAAAAAIELALLLWLPRRLTALYRAERDARAAAERGDRASRALTHVREAVALLDEAGRVVYLNQRAEELFGAADDSLDAVLGAVGSTAELDVQGERREFELARTVFAGGRVVVLRDLTEEQALERARSDFVTTAAHELRTPIAAIFGAIKTLGREDVDLGSPLGRRLLAVIEEESERLAVIVEQILVTAQLDRGRVALDLAPVDLRELAEGIVRAAEVSSPAGLDVVIEDGARPYVRADATRLRQVLANLVDNAVKYSPGGGTVIVRLGNGDGRGRLDVVDGGLGIPLADQERIFEKFYRLDPSLRRGIGGSGLGLYISRRLVEQMQGSISVRSRPGAGSTFTVELPLAE